MCSCDFAVDVRTLLVYVHACKRVCSFVRVRVALAPLLSCVMDTLVYYDERQQLWRLIDFVFIFRSVHCLETY